MTMSALPKVLLLGDSIRGSYQAIVTEILDGKAEVVGPAENCQFSLYTLSSLGRWINKLGEPDIVHWNNGIHDCGHNPLRGPAQFSVDDFRTNVGSILTRLRELTPKVIWATITPVHPDRPFVESGWSWRNEEIDPYNVAARELMEANEVPINDLHSLVWSDVDQFLSDDQLHLSDAGKQVCAQAVAESVSKLLSNQ
jgi:lysophospholipase L1-like esterase